MWLSRTPVGVQIILFSKGILPGKVAYECDYRRQKLLVRPRCLTKSKLSANKTIVSGFMLVTRLDCDQMR